LKNKGTYDNPGGGQLEAPRAQDGGGRGTAPAWVAACFLVRSVCNKEKHPFSEQRSSYDLHFIVTVQPAQPKHITFHLTLHITRAWKGKKTLDPNVPPPQRLTRHRQKRVVLRFALETKLDTKNSRLFASWSFGYTFSVFDLFPSKNLCAILI
jgi:hypothetical protein